ALSVLEARGVVAAAKKTALMIERLLMMDAVSGEEVCNIPCAPFERAFGNPYAVAHRAHVHGPLLHGWRPNPLIELRPDSRAMGFEPDNTGVAVMLQS